MDSIQFSIVIPTYKREVFLKTCLCRLSEQLIGYSNYEIIVVDDGGGLDGFDEKADFLKGINVKLFHQEHKGPAGARNFGISVARGEIILFLDDDNVPQDDWFKETVRAWGNLTEIDGMGGYVMGGKSANIYSRLNADFFNWYLDQSTSGNYCNFLATCNAGYRKSMLQKVGGFDENFKNAAGEDRDINIKILNSGGKLKLDRKILVHYAASEGFGKFIKRHLRYGYAVHQMQVKYPDSTRLPLKSYASLYAVILKRYEGIAKRLFSIVLIVFLHVSTLAGYILAGLRRDFTKNRIPLTTRLDANLGYECNNNCLFCYFRSRKEQRRNISTEKAKGLLSLIRRLGIDTLEITGGEPAIREDIFELIYYAKEELKFKKITIITNGSRFCDKEFAKEAISRGLDEVLVSIHGHEPVLHDTLVDRKGAFDDAIKAIRNVIELGASCRTNTVITKLNYEKVKHVARLVHDLGIRRVNYIYFSPLDDAACAETNLWPRYSESSPFIKDMIESYKDNFEMISMKVIPFCFLEECQDYITDYFQNVYDPYEWDYYYRVGIRRGRFIRDAAAIGGVFLFMDVRRIFRIGLQKSLREGILHVEALRHCVKPKACRKCRFNLICPGVWKAYAREFGLDEVKPIRGKKVSDVDHFLYKRFANAEFSNNTGL